MMDAFPLIVGAGPVGMSAALFLAEAGIRTRIIDVKDQPSHHSKALAVNPRTLELLERTGVTQTMLANGLRIRGGRFWKHGKPAADVLFEALPHKYPFMLALSQASSERLLEQALERAGGKVERGTELTACSNQADGTVVAALQHRDSGRRETAICPWLLAADGAHSTTRQTTEVDFPGSSFQNLWHLADVPLHTRLDGALAHAFFDDRGFLFLIRVIQDAASRSAIPPLWRVISNQRALLSEIPQSEVAGAPVWTSDFHISHRINAHFQVGNIYFAGDAAHIHSPIGARGMNLGIEDAWVFSELVRTRHVHRYEGLRKPVDRAVVKRVERLSRVVRGESLLARMIRSAAIPLLTRLPALQRLVLPAITGLDHDLAV
jgi:2-polyprenyl-6-methoxyphenol hydroxylase-like FAD-dependent oxidoreductase